jgi:hypothetical protein
MTLWPIPPAEVARFAAQEYERRRGLASDAVRARKTTFDKAQLALRPWMAIAALAGAEFDELTDLLAEHRTRQVYRPGDGKGWRDELQDDCEARIALAEALCPSGEWRTELERAKDAAQARAFDEATLERAGKFVALSRALPAPLTSLPKKEPA